MSSATAATSDDNSGGSTGNGTITASPNPAAKTSNGDSMTTISWNAPSGVTAVMITIGSPVTRTLSDKWTVVTADGSLSAHFEHTVAILADGPRILTTA